MTIPEGFNYFVPNQITFCDRWVFHSKIPRKLMIAVTNNPRRSIVNHFAINKRITQISCKLKKEFLISNIKVSMKFQNKLTFKFRGYVHSIFAIFVLCWNTFPQHMLTVSAILQFQFVFERIQSLSCVLDIQQFCQEKRSIKELLLNFL